MNPPFSALPVEIIAHSLQWATALQLMQLREINRKLHAAVVSFLDDGTSASGSLGANRYH
jgi:hypothetical protein